MHWPQGQSLESVKQSGLPGDSGATWIRMMWGWGLQIIKIEPKAPPQNSGLVEKPRNRARDKDLGKRVMKERLAWGWVGRMEARQPAHNWCIIKSPTTGGNWRSLCQGPLTTPER